MTEPSGDPYATPWASRTRKSLLERPVAHGRRFEPADHTPLALSVAEDELDRFDRLGQPTTARAAGADERPKLPAQIGLDTVDEPDSDVALRLGRR